MTIYHVYSGRRRGAMVILRGANASRLRYVESLVPRWATGPGTLVMYISLKLKLNCIFSYRNHRTENCYVTESSINKKKKKSCLLILLFTTKCKSYDKDFELKVYYINAYIRIQLLLFLQ